MLFRLSLLSLAILASLPQYVLADDEVVSLSKPETIDVEESIEFNEQFLLNKGGAIDVSRYSLGNPVPAGKYRATVNLNGKIKTTADIEFKDNGTPRATPCLTPLLLAQTGIDTSKLNEPHDDTVTCIDIKDQYPGASVHYDTGKQALDLNFPQLYVLKLPQGYVDPSLWDNGIPAALLSYDLNAWHNENNSNTSDTAYMGLHYGLNMGPWRLRSRGNLDWNSDNGSHYSSQDIYLQRDIVPLRAQMVAGDSYTRGDTFDSISLRGLRMYNDDRMLPGASSTFAPIVRGVANSNAKVTITQSGNKIYETTVPPGAFEISDISTTGYGNDLFVTVEESDGSKRTFSIPFSSVTQMLRPGSVRWDIGAGELNDDSLSDRPNVAYGTLYYGINNTFTGYLGAQATSEDFYAGLFGIAMNTAIGAFAFDITQSRAKIDEIGTLSGQSYRLNYSKMVEMTKTSFNVAAYRFSTEDYLSLHDAASLANDVKHGEYRNQSYSSGEDLYNNFQRMKNQVQISMNQPLSTADNAYGSLYISGSWQDYWNQSDSTSNYSVGYNNSFRYGSYSLSVQRTYNDNGDKDDSVYLSLNIPFNTLFGQDSTTAGFSSLNIGMRSDLSESNSINTTASGSTKDTRLSYSVTASSSGGDYGDINQIGGYATWNSPYGPVGTSLSAGDDGSKQYSASYNGGMVIHSGGITLAPGSIGDNDALALVNASGAKGARLNYGHGEIGQSGYGILPYMSPYRENRVGIDITTLENDVELKSTSAVVVPRDGSVIRVNFETDEGKSLILELARSDHGFIPLGADVLNDKGDLVGSVGQAGQAYVRGIEEQGTLRVVWGNANGSACTVHYRINTNAPKAGLTTILNNQTCQMQ